MKKNDDGKPSIDSSPEKEIIENDDKDISIILDDELVDEHGDVEPTLAPSNDEESGVIEDAIINGEIKNDYSSAMSFLDQIKQQKK